MKKVIGTTLAAIILVAAFPMTASAGNIKPRCGTFLRPCPNTMPPVVTGGGSNGTHSGGGSTGNGTSKGGGSRALPPGSMPPVAGR